MAVDAGLQVLDEPEWRERERAHRNAVDDALAGHAERARTGRTHPVHDFLFTYYSLRPARLRRWHPGAGAALAGPSARDRLTWADHAEVLIPTPGGRPTSCVTLDVESWTARRAPGVEHVRDLLVRTAGRRPMLGCFGLHEWAMLYRDQGTRRHPSWPLRLGQQGTDDVVEASALRCTHVDALRFFPPDALPRNAAQPVRADQPALEQPGCVHATMDLYKWAYKLLPAVPSSLVLDCFRLARDARELDMRASPYDLTALGYEPVPVETTQGKAAYVEAQRELAARAAPLRARLIEHCDAVLGPVVSGAAPASAAARS